MEGARFFLLMIWLLLILFVCFAYILCHLLRFIMGVTYNLLLSAFLK